MQDSVGNSMPDATPASIEFRLSINATLHEDLIQQAKACEIEPARYAAEVIESFVASRRLEQGHSIAPGDVQPAISSIYSLGA